MNSTTKEFLISTKSLESEQIFAHQDIKLKVTIKPCRPGSDQRDLAESTFPVSQAGDSNFTLNDGHKQFVGSFHKKPQAK